MDYDTYFFHHDGEDFWEDEYHETLYENLEAYVVNGGRHRCLADGQPNSAARAFLLNMQRFTDSSLTQTSCVTFTKLIPTILPSSHVPISCSTCSKHTPLLPSLELKCLSVWPLRLFISHIVVKTRVHVATPIERLNPKMCLSEYYQL